MKTSIHSSSAVLHGAIATGVALLIALAGCAHAPLRHTSSELDVTSVHDLPPGVTAPMPIHTVAPEFPYFLRRLGIEGRAEIYCLVDADGAVRDVSILSGSGLEFAFSARDALRKWRFAPATRNGSPVTMGAVIPFKFAFEPEKPLFQP